MIIMCVRIEEKKVGEGGEGSQTVGLVNILFIEMHGSETVFTTQ